MVDTLRLERSAERCAGSTPVSGTMIKKWLLALFLDTRALAWAIEMNYLMTPKESHSESIILTADIEYDENISLLGEEGHQHQTN